MEGRRNVNSEKKRLLMQVFLFPSTVEKVGWMKG